MLSTRQYVVVIVVIFDTGESVSDWMMQSCVYFSHNVSARDAWKRLHVTSQIVCAADWLIKQQYLTHYRRSCGTRLTSVQRLPLMLRYDNDERVCSNTRPYYELYTSDGREYFLTLSLSPVPVQHHLLQSLFPFLILIASVNVWTYLFFLHNTYWRLLFRISCDLQFLKAASVNS